MKRTILMIAGALALVAANSMAQEGHVIINSTHAEEDARAAALDRAEQRANQQTFANLYHRMATNPPPHVDKVTQMYNEWAGGQLAKQQPQVHVGELTQGDPLPRVSNLYDDLATIRLYLRDSGYTDLSDAQILKVRDYMKAHGIRHVSELAQ